MCALQHTIVRPIALVQNVNAHTQRNTRELPESRIVDFMTRFQLYRSLQMVVVLTGFYSH